MAVLGKVAMTAKGEWSNTTTYEKLDLVTKTESSHASLYIATDDIAAGTDLSNSKWMKLYTVKNGTNGTNGTPGAKGDTGAAATISVGTVTSGAVASVKNSGTTSAAKFDFVLPKGDKGDNGDPGTDGKYITAIALTKDDTGAITGGTATMNDKTTVAITVS